jgi:integrase
MARPPLALGHHGSIKVSRDDGQWVARCRFRDLDGVTRRVARWGTTKAGAQAVLQDELRQRTGQRTEVLKPNSRFREAAEVWMGKIRERRADSTADTYSSCLRNQVLPHLGELRLSECDTAHLDAFFSRLEQARKVVQQADGTTAEKPQHAANTRRMIRAIVGGVMQQAVLHQAVAANPVRDLERIESPKGHKKAPPRGLTAEERRRLLTYVDTHKTAVRADMPDLIRFALGSGLRIGENCAVRWMDLDLDGIPVEAKKVGGQAVSSKRLAR